MDSIINQRIKVELINTPTLDHIDRAIGMCHGKGCISDPIKRKERILRVVHKEHLSVLRFIDFIYEIQAPDNTLAQIARHQVGMDLMVESTRYTIKKRIDSGDPLTVLQDIEEREYRDRLRSLVLMGMKNDDICLRLPKGYLYRFLLKCNAQALLHFLDLRLAPSAHLNIRITALRMLHAIPKDIQFLVPDKLWEYSEQLIAKGYSPENVLAKGDKK